MLSLSVLENETLNGRNEMYVVALYNRDDMTEMVESRTFATAQGALRGRIEMMIAAKLAGLRTVATGIMKISFDNISA